METRTIKELLQVMLDYKKLFYSGLCYWAGELRERDLITHEEYITLNRYIQKNRPSKYSSIKAFINRDKPHYWPRNGIKPRIKWIKYHIKKNN